MLESQRRQSELYLVLFTLIVFTQVNSRPTMLFYSLVFLLFIGSSHGYFTTFNINSFYR